MFTLSYWKKAFHQIKNIRVLALCSIFVAMQVMSSSVFVQVSENLRIYFSFNFTALFSCIGGPVMALISGFCADIISFMLFPSGAFFFGYTLSAMLGAFLFALFLWDTRITILKLIFSRVVIFFRVRSTCLLMRFSLRSSLFPHHITVKKNATMAQMPMVSLMLFFMVILIIYVRSYYFFEFPTKVLLFFDSCK
jgi:ECF transporter S component (folate family)